MNVLLIAPFPILDILSALRDIKNPRVSGTPDTRANTSPVMW